MKKGHIIKVIPTKKGRWEVFTIHNPKRKKPVRVRKMNGSMIEGYFDFGTRIISRNGRGLQIGTGFNTVAIALKNIKAVQTTCV